MVHIPASIRNHNPGAMWGHNPVAERWGALGTEDLHDGLNQGNNIAIFPDYVHGICAQIDLWRSPRYRNKTFKDAIEVWAGGNSVGSYIAFVLARVPGMTADTRITDAFLNSATGIKFLQAQAWHEAGEKYPAPDADWAAAQKLVFAGVVPAHKKAVTGAVVAGATATAAHQAGAPPWVAALIGVAIAAIALFAWGRFNKS